MAAIYTPHYHVYAMQRHTNFREHIFCLIPTSNDRKVYHLSVRPKTISREGHSHRLYHNCDRSRSAVNDQSRSKGCSQRSKCVQNCAIFGQNTLRNTVKQQIWVGLGMTSKVKGQSVVTIDSTGVTPPPP